MPKTVSKSRRKTSFMKIIVEGKFKGSVNNVATIDIYRPNSQPNPFNYSKTVNGNFKETITGLAEDTRYDIDFFIFTTGTCDIKISGDFKTSPITASFSEGGFTPGFPIRTTTAQS